MILKRIYSIFLFLVLGFSTLGQDNKVQLQVAIQRVNETTRSIVWVPNNYDTFLKGLQNGYSLTRHQLVNGVRTNTVTLSANVQQKDSLWVANNFESDHPYYRLLQVCSSLIKNPGAIDGTNHKWDVNNKKDQELFEILASEVHDYLIPGLVTGMAYLDTMVVEDSTITYTYQVQVNNSPISIAFDADEIIGLSTGFATQLPFKVTEDKRLGSNLIAKDRKIGYNIAAIAKAYGDSIVIKWVPNNAGFWKEALLKGYEIKRTLDLSSVRRSDNKDSSYYIDGILHRELIIAGFGVKPYLKPLPDSLQTKEYFGTDTLAMVAASVMKKDKPNGLSPYAQAEAQQHAYASAMLAAEQSRLASEVLGLVYVDRNVVKGHTYVYTINSPAGTIFSTAEVVVKNIKESIPPPTNVSAYGGFYTIHVTWPKTQNYTFFHLERSDDKGKTFTRITKRPTMFFETAGSTDKNTYTDSVPLLNTTYYYRVIGINTLGEESEPSVVNAQAIDLLAPGDPTIEEIKHIGSDSLFISFSGDSLSSDIESYKLHWSNSQLGPFEPVAEFKNKINKGFVVTPKLFSGSSHYFKLYCFDKNKNYSESTISFLQIADTIPPSIPTNFRAQMDSAGVVVLIWSAPPVDVSEYYIYSRIDTNFHFSRISSGTYTDTVFIDTINPYSLKEYMYYGVKAVDSFYNLSPTATVAVERFDTVAPKTPIFSSYQLVGNKAVLDWTASSAKDVTHFLLERKCDKDSADWSLLDSIVAPVNEYTDTTVKSGFKYWYRISAMDDDNNKSKKSNPVMINYPLAQVSGMIEELHVGFEPTTKTLNLTWKLPTVQVDGLKNVGYYFQVYKSTSGAPLDYYKKTSITQYNDPLVDVGGTYTYAVKVVYENGFETELCSPFTIIAEEGQP